MTEVRCALVSAEQDEPLLGTAPEATDFLLVEMRGGWAGKILATEMPEDVRRCLSPRVTAHRGWRRQFIRAARGCSSSGRRGAPAGHSPCTSAGWAGRCPISC